LIAEIVLSTDMAKQTIIYVKCYANWFNFSDCIFLFIVFVYFRLLNFFFIYVVLPHMLVK